MKYHELRTAQKKTAKRVGRGIAAGRGKTAGRGTKGQGARAGFSKRPGFEGGQNPLMQRLPKLRGFRSLRQKSENIYTEQLNSLGAHVTNKSLAEAGLVSGEFVSVKLLHRGDVTKKVNVQLQAASLNAMEAVQKAGGSFTAVPRPMRPAKKKESK
ncbi:50S ribosomal protein L15 [Candidatus Saccharibacteria bacterium]|nr:ribosomal protein L15 [uncultured bacterium]PID30588.1 MAG: 50S ribosomal protein L15 [Candidatus Saccharibacteria bacterium]PID99330.1 MAG: 50S ribosomal protein L15 [Candidatus Saccharibacteria bacterium]